MAIAAQIFNTRGQSRSLELQPGQRITLAQDERIVLPPLIASGVRVVVEGADVVLLIDGEGIFRIAGVSDPAAFAAEIVANVAGAAPDDEDELQNIAPAAGQGRQDASSLLQPANDEGSSFGINAEADGPEVRDALTPVVLGDIPLPRDVVVTGATQSQTTDIPGAVGGSTPAPILDAPASVVTDNPPVAAPVSGNTSPTTVGPITGGAAVEDAVLTLTGAAGALWTNVRDVDTGAVFSVTAQTIAGTYGSLTIAANGSYTYALNNASAAVQSLAAGQTRTESFTYAISDGAGGTVNQTINFTIDGANDAPTTTGPITGATLIDESVATTIGMSGSLFANISDVDAGTVFSVTAATAGVQFGTYGALSVLTTGGYTYTLNYSDPDTNALAAGQTEIESFTVTISDGAGGTVNQTINLTIQGVNDGPTVGAAINVAPALVEDAATTTSTGGIGALFANVSDVDAGTTFTTTAQTIAGTYGSLTIAADGSYAYTLNDADPDTNALNTGDTRTESFTYAVSDGQGGTVNQTIYFTIQGATDVAANIAPVVTGETGPDAILGSAQVYSIAALLGNDSDADGGTLSITGVTATNGTAVLNAAAGTITFQANAGYTGPASFTYTVSDGQGGTAQGIVAVNVVSSYGLGGVAAASALLAAQPGFTLIGEGEGDFAGVWVARAGDVNGDGIDDLIVGASLNDNAGGMVAGASYVIFGGQAALTGSVSLGQVGGAVQGFRLTGEAADDRAGQSVSAAGDIDGDGIGDLIVGATRRDIAGGTDAGAAYVIYGGQGLTGSISLADVVSGAVRGFRLTGEGASDLAGLPVSSAGDVNGDGIDDLIFGAFLNNAGGSDAGAAYVIYGGQNLTGSISLSQIGTAGLRGFRLTGETTVDWAGSAVSSAGDVNGDGIDDLIVGAPSNSLVASPGAAYVIFGGQNLTGSISLADVGGAVQGFRLTGEVAGNQAGFSVSSAGDIDGDGIDDLIVGAPLNGAIGVDAGASYVIYGGQGLTGSVSLSDVASGAVRGFRLTGEAASDNAGISVSRAGDVDGDGINDLIVGASGATATGTSGATYVIFGGQALTGSISLSQIGTASLRGFRLTGQAADDEAGRPVSAAGDLDGDGFDDLILGAANNDAGGTDAGAAYVIYGGDFSRAVTTDLRTAGTLTGDGGAQRFVGSAGNDMLIGGGGADALSGGAGNDVLAISDTSFRSIDGGGGVDTLRVDGAALDLTTIADNRIASMERIDLASNGAAQTLTLNARDLFALSEGQAVQGVANSIIVNAGMNDTVSLTALGAGDPLAGGSWVANGARDIGGVTYNAIEYRDAGGVARGTLFVQSGAMVISDETGPTAILGSAQVYSIAALLANDIAANGGTLSITGVTATNGTAVLDAGAGTITFQANAGFTGPAGFTYTVAGDRGGSAQGTVAVNVVSSYGLGGAATASTLLAQQPGFRLTGEAANNLAGQSVSSAGDVNGDGIDDLIVGAFQNSNAGGAFAGAAYVIFGGQNLTGSISLSQVGGAVQGFRLTGEAAVDQAGASVSAAGDVDGDGIDDLIVGATRHDITGTTDAGATYVIFGGQGLSGSISLSDVVSGAVRGFRLTAEAVNDFAGNRVSALGDVNGDGIDDLIIGAEGNDIAGDRAGAAYVIYGGQNLTGSISLNQIGTANLRGFRLTGEAASDIAGSSVSSAGDVNGDGIDDLIVGAPRNNLSAGAAYVIFGGQTFASSISFSQVGGAVRGFRLTGEAAGDQVGFSVSAAGDVDGDGIGDLIVDAIFNDNAGGANAGATYVIFGGQAALTGSISLSDVVSGTVRGFRLTGEAAVDRPGISVSRAGDLDGDGIDDLIVGADLNDAGSADSGAAYVIFGGQALTGSISLSQVGGAVRGFRLTGEAGGDNAGRSVSSAGDLDGDGFDDLIVGAINNDTGGANAGASYVIYGGDFSRAVTGDLRAAGTLTGDGAAQRFVGSAGNDTLIGGGGADALSGDAGNDVLAISDTTFRRIDGGGGVDTLRVDGAALDLTTIAENRIESVERIDLATNTAAQTLTLNARDLFALSEGQAVAGVANSITVDADVNDTINLTALGVGDPLSGGSWVANGTRVIDTVTYNAIEYRDAGGAVRGTLFVTDGAAARGPSGAVIASLVAGGGGDGGGDALRVGDLFSDLDGDLGLAASGATSPVGPSAYCACDGEQGIAMSGPALLLDSDLPAAA